MERHILTQNKLIHAQVCSEGTWDEALEWIRSTNPAGTENNWSKEEEERFAPVQCADVSTRTHYIFTC